MTLNGVELFGLPYLVEVLKEEVSSAIRVRLIEVSTYALKSDPVCSHLADVRVKEDLKVGCVGH